MIADAVADRAWLHAAVGEPMRLAIVEELTSSDRTPSELAGRFELTSNLLAHHLAVLERVGLVERVTSSGDRRRRYVCLRTARLGDLIVSAPAPTGPVLFVCTHNSARSQLAAALWRDRTGNAASSAGTHPAARVHRGAVAAARRIGLDLTEATPRRLSSADLIAEKIVTVCDRAHEELDGSDAWLHWSIPDPAEAGTRAAFDATVTSLDERISTLSALPTGAPCPPAMN